MNRSQKKNVSGIKASLLLLLLWVIMLGTTVMAATAADLDDPDYIKRLLNEKQRKETVAANRDFEDADANPYTGMKYTHDEQFRDCDIIMGIDVSKHNGVIDWKKVKEAGIDFAIIRIGYSTLSDGAMLADSDGMPENYFALNVQNARAAGVKIGVYYFSQAITEKEAHAEAAFTLKALNGLKLDYPVVFDYEEFTGYRLAKAKIKASKGNKICKAFCDDIKAAGYDAMVYVGYNASTERMLVDAEQLGKEVPLWVSRYNTILQYPYSCVMWQYTDNGKISGINGSTDCDFYYVSKSNKQPETPQSPETPADLGGSVTKLSKVTGLSTTAVSSKSVKISFKAVTNATGYQIWRAKGYDGTYKKIATITSTVYTDTSFKEGQEMYYQVRAYAKSDGQTIYGDFSSQKAGRTAYANSCKVTATVDANLRQHAGSGYGQLAVLKKGTVCTLKAYTYSADNVIWYLVKVKVNGTSYTGYLSSRCAVLNVKKVTALKAKSKAAKSITLQWAAQSGVTGYQIYRADAKNGSYKKIATVKDVTTWKDTGLSKYTQYYYKVRAYSKVNGVITKGAFSSVATLGTSMVTVRYKAKAAVYLRKNAGTGYQKLTVIPKGNSITVYYRTKDKLGNTWYYAKVNVKGKSYKGYVRAYYVKKS